MLSQTLLLLKASTVICQLLEDNPGCGVPGRRGEECIWDCDWIDNPLFLKTATVRDDDNNFITKKFNNPKIVQDVSCLADCTVVQSCLKAGPYTDLDTMDLCILALGLGGFDALKAGLEIKATMDVMVYESCTAHKFLKDGQRCGNLPLRRSKRLDGMASFPSSSLEDSSTLGRYPWACSLQPRSGGRHLCGLTLLSTPPMASVLVGAAHCTYLCKDNTGRVQDSCCCRPEQDPASCTQTNSFCGEESRLRMALPDDVVVVCGEWFTGPLSTQDSPEEEVVLLVERLVTHPEYSPAVGVLGGGDVAVYMLQEDSKRRLGQAVADGLVRAVCLPRPDSLKDGGRAVFSGWKQPYPLTWLGYVKGFLGGFTDYAREFQILRHVMLEVRECKDPAWMKSDSYYPRGTFCAVDPSSKTCFDTGDSGSGLVAASSAGTYVWLGLLSFYRGCDGWLYNSAGGAAGENPGIFSQASCYMSWIAGQYGLTWSGQSQCSKYKGRAEDRGLAACLTRSGKPCLFNTSLSILATNV